MERGGENCGERIGVWWDVMLTGYYLQSRMQVPVRQELVDGQTSSAGASSNERSRRLEACSGVKRPRSDLLGLLLTIEAKAQVLARSETKLPMVFAVRTVITLLSNLNIQGTHPR